MNYQSILNLVVIALAAAGGATITAISLAQLGLTSAWVAAPSAVCGAWASLLAMNQLEVDRDQKAAERASAK